MDGRGKNGEKWPFFCHPPSSLRVQPVPGRRGQSANTAAHRPPRRRMVHALQVCKPVVLEFHDEEASPSFPRLWQPTISLFFLLPRSLRRVHVASLPLCHCLLCIFMLYPILPYVLPLTFEVPISGIPAKFWSQHLFQTLSRCSNFGAFKDLTFLILCFLKPK